VVHHGHQHVIVVGYPEEGGVERNLGGQIERVTGRCTHAAVEPIRRPTAGIDCLPTNVDLIDGQYDLRGCAVVRREEGAEAFVAGHYIGQRGAQRVDVKAPAQPQRYRQVVDGRGTLQFVEEPQPVLGERQWHHRGPLSRHQRFQPGRIAADAWCQLGNRGGLEHRAHRKIDVKAAVDGTDESHR
jgi:hypothetical protein